MSDFNDTIITYITPMNILIIFIICIAISVISCVFFKSYGGFDVSRYHIFTVVFTALLGIFAVFFGMLISYSLASQYEVSKARLVMDTNKAVYQELEQYVAEIGKILPHFAQSMSPLGKQYEIPPDATGPTNERLKVAVANHVFTVWDYFRIDESISSGDPTPYIYYLLQYCNSKALLEKWSYMRLGFPDADRTIGDVLFEYAQKITEHTPANYEKVAKEVANDPRFKDAIKQV